MSKELGIMIKGYCGLCYRKLEPKQYVLCGDCEEMVRVEQ